MKELQFVVFRLNDEIYAADIKYVGGITEYTKITPIPNTPSYVHGIINLRGEVIPILNLKHIFNFVDKNNVIDSDTNSRIILYNIENKDVGFIVDEASQVIKIPEDDIEEPPALLKGKYRDFITGIGKLNGEVVILLDLKNVMSI